jgi:acyl carrier protein
MTIVENVDGLVRDHVRHFLMTNFLYLHPGLQLRDSDDLLALALLDSLGFVELVEEVQERYDVAVEDSEITAANFGSINAIATFVQAKLRGRSR